MALIRNGCGYFSGPPWLIERTSVAHWPEFTEARAKTASTIFCSQFDVPGWHENLYDPTLADAICDRIVYDSYIIRIEGDTMRKHKGIMD